MTEVVEVRQFDRLLFYKLLPDGMPAETAIVDPSDGGAD